MRWNRHCGNMGNIFFTAFIALLILAGTGEAFQSPSPTIKTTADAPTSQNQNSDVETKRKYLSGKISEYSERANRTYDFMWGLLHITILIVCIIIIRHTALATKGARFMRCFINSYAITACFYVGVVLMPYFLAYMAKNIPTDESVSLKGLETSLLKLIEIEYMWDAIDSFLSLFSSFFLILGWHLLKRYPKESITREFYTVLNMIFAAIVAPLLVGVLLLRQPDAYQLKSKTSIFLLVDTFAAGIAICLFGWELWRRMRPPKSRGRRSWLLKFWPWLSSPIPIIFLVWGVAQPAYIYFHDKGASHWYFGALLILKLLAGISVVIAAASVLKERPPFQTETGGIASDQASA